MANSKFKTQPRPLVDYAWLLEYVAHAVPGAEKSDPLRYYFTIAIFEDFDEFPEYVDKFIHHYGIDRLSEGITLDCVTMTGRADLRKAESSYCKQVRYFCQSLASVLRRNKQAWANTHKATLARIEKEVLAIVKGAFADLRADL